MPQKNNPVARPVRPNSAGTKCDLHILRRCGVGRGSHQQVCTRTHVSGCIVSAYATSRRQHGMQSGTAQRNAAICENLGREFFQLQDIGTGLCPDDRILGIRDFHHQLLLGLGVFEPCHGGCRSLIQIQAVFGKQQ